MGNDEREGQIIYQEGKVEVRTFPKDAEAHSIYIGDNFFLFQHRVLEQYAMRTAPEEMRVGLATYNLLIPHILDEEEISAESFALILARARIKEIEMLISTPSLL